MRSALAVVLAVAAVTATAGATFILRPHGSRPVSVQQPTDGVVRDGTRVTATGRVVQVAGGPIRFCPPLPIADVGYAPGKEPAPSDCGRLGVTLDGADLTALSRRREKDGAVEGWARVTGTFRAGVVAVDEQEPASEVGPAPARGPDTPPCTPPDGGWPRNSGQDDINLMPQMQAATGYRHDHPQDVIDLALERPSTDQVLLGVIALDAAAQQRVDAALRPTFGSRLCVTVSRYTPEQISSARTALGPDRMQSLGLWSSGQTVTTDLQVQTDADAVMLTPELADVVAQHPQGLLKVNPWLVPF